MAHGCIASPCPLCAVVNVTVLPDAGRDEMLKQARYTSDGKPKRKRRRRGTAFERRQGMYGR